MRLLPPFLGLLRFGRASRSSGLSTCGNHAGGDVDITCGGFQLLMTQQHLDLSDMGVVIEQVSGEAMAQRMQRHAFLNPGSVRRFME